VVAGAYYDVGTSSPICVRSPSVHFLLLEGLLKQRSLRVSKKSLEFLQTADPDDCQRHRM
jgi:hypothetical protein